MSSKKSKSNRPRNARASHQTERVRVPFKQLKQHPATAPFLDTQGRVYEAKATASAAHALAHAQEENSDLALVLRGLADSLESIANGMGDYLPIWAVSK